MDYYKLHPDTLKSLKNLHPWVTKDKFSVRLPADQKLIELYDPGDERTLGTFIHDPNHPKVVARFWSKKKLSFMEEFSFRLKRSIEKRSMIKNRENQYLVFGEADLLPGLFIQKLGGIVLIQYHCFYWEDYLEKIIKNLKEYGLLNFWTQKRIPGEKKSAPTPYSKNLENEIVISENQIKFKLKFNLNHDIGLYTDMSSMRSEIAPYFKNSRNVLNLFSYTGAFSLMGLKENIKVSSVDISRNYMSWLEENIALNNFDNNLHQSIIKPCHKALEELQENNNQFDLIICDPPSFSTDKKKRKSVKDFYKEELSHILNLLSERGSAIIFLNTYQTSRSQFRNLIKSLLIGTEFKINRELFMREDCSPLKNFPEGDYLKGLILGR